VIVVLPDAGVAVVDVVLLDAGRQAERMAQDRETAEHLVRRPGFVSTSLHRSLDGLRVTTYTQWRDAGAASAAQPGTTAYEVVHVQKAPSAGPAIVEGTVPLTLIVVMTCEPAEQAELVDYLIGIAIEHSANPGFVSCTIHRGLDGTHVAEYIQWTDTAALGAMAAKPASQAHFARVKPRSSSAMYEVIAAIEAPAGRA
jgi:quinol monooxygenase YgiN